MTWSAACECNGCCVVYEAEDARVLTLLWHGRGANEGQVLRPLAEALRAGGAAVVVPDWDSTSADHGRRVLGHSLACASARARGLPVILVGWSLGGTAALSVALQPVDGPIPAAAVGLAADVRSTSPLNGIVPLDFAGTGTGSPAIPLVLVSGNADHIVEPSGTRMFVSAALSRSWCVAHREVDTDHAGVVGTEYDCSRGLCVPSSAPRALVGQAAALWAVDEALRLTEAAT